MTKRYALALAAASLAAVLLSGPLAAVDLALFPCGDGFHADGLPGQPPMPRDGAAWVFYIRGTVFGGQETDLRLCRATWTHGWLRLTFTTPRPRDRTWTFVCEGVRGENLPFEFNREFEFTVEDLHRFRRQACQRALAARAVEPAITGAAPRDRPLTRDELQQDSPEVAPMIPEGPFPELPYSLLPAALLPADPDRAAPLPADLFDHGRLDLAAWDVHRRAAAAALEAPPPACAGYQLLPVTRVPRQWCTFQVRGEDHRPIAGLTLTVHQFARWDNWPDAAQTLVTDSAGCVSLPVWHDAAAWLELGDPLTTPQAWRPAPAGAVLAYPRLKPVPLASAPIPVTLYSLSPRRLLTGRLQLESPTGWATATGQHGESLQVAAQHCRIVDAMGDGEYRVPAVDADGRFTLPPLPAGTYRFCVADGSRYSALGGSPFCIDPAGELAGGGELNLVLRQWSTHSVTYVVTDADSGEPLPGIAVGEGDWLHGLYQYTDQHGRLGPFTRPSEAMTDKFRRPSGTHYKIPLIIDHDGDYPIVLPSEYRLYLPDLNGWPVPWKGFLVDDQGESYRLQRDQAAGCYATLPAHIALHLSVFIPDRDYESDCFTLCLESNQTITLPALPSEPVP